MSFAFFPNRLGSRVEGAKDPADIALRHTEREELACDRRGVRGLGRPEAAIAAAAIGRADRAAAGLRDGAKAGCSPGDHDANGAPQFAFMTDAVPGDRRLAPDQEGFDNLEELALVDRATAQLEIDPRDIVDPNCPIRHELRFLSQTPRQPR